MKILLTGASGFLGSFLISELSKSHFVFELSRNSSVFKCDLSKCIPHFDKHFDLVIHSAGKAHQIPTNENEHTDFYNTNVIGTSNLLKGLSQTSLPKQFVFISSVSVYGASQGFNISEDSPLSAIDSYGKSKIKSEDIVYKWCSENNVICTIFRLPLVVGPNPPGNLGSMINAINNGYYFNIAGGVARKSMVLASDIAQYLLKASSVGGIYNLTDGHHPNFLELSECIANQVGKKTLPNIPFFLAKNAAFFGDFFGKNFPLNSIKLYKITSTLTFDDTKARNAFGWNPTPVLNGFNINE